MPNACSVASGRQDLPYGAFGEIFWETQCQEMQQLADRVIACRQPGQSMEIDLACNGVQITAGCRRCSRMACCAGVPLY